MAVSETRSSNQLQTTEANDSNLVQEFDLKCIKNDQHVMFTYFSTNSEHRLVETFQGS